MQRNGYTFRAGTHVVQKINNDALINASLFWNEAHDIIKKNGLGNVISLTWMKLPLFLICYQIKLLLKGVKKHF